MPLALTAATALHAHIIIFPIEPQGRQMYITPEIESVLGTVFVVYDLLGSRHYDAALPFDKSPSQRAMTTGCSCGVNSDDKS